MSFEVLLDRFCAMTARTLGENLVGIYLHGSAAMACFNPERSDLDLLIVVERQVLPEAKRAFLMGVLELNGDAPAKGLELSIVRREFCRPFVHPMPFELHVSNTHLDWLRRDLEGYVRDMNGTDPDLAAHVTIINHRGRTLLGESIGNVFGPVSREDYIDSIWYDVQNAREDILRDPVYITLNLCRVLAYLQEGLVLSKREGGQWGIRALPEHSALLQYALDCYASDQTMETGETAAAFAGDLLTQIQHYL